MSSSAFQKSARLIGLLRKSFFLLHRTLELWFAHRKGPLTGQRGYLSA